MVSSQIDARSFTGAIFSHTKPPTNIDNMGKIIEIVQKTGALTATRDAAAAEAQRALDALQNLPQNAYADALRQLASQLLDRRA